MNSRGSAEQSDVVFVSESSLLSISGVMMGSCAYIFGYALGYTLASVRKGLISDMIGVQSEGGKRVFIVFCRNQVATT